MAQYGYGYGGASTSAVAASLQASTSTMSSMAASSSSASQVSVQVVKVSNKNGSLIFAPNDIKASAGSMIQFHFYPKNHSVVQSTFDQPCEPINNNQANVTGLFSGFMPVAANASTMPTYTILVNDTKPIWFYCSQAKHCQSGMVGVVNAPASNTSRTLASFQALAVQAPANLSPGEGETGSTSSNTTSTSGSSSGSSSSAAGSSGSVAPSNTTSSGAAAATTNAAPGSMFAGPRQVFMNGQGPEIAEMDIVMIQEIL
ncbi:MAG: hypothetical protein M1827_006093 [Pycnora praestabilis]|nr:MAG: hypothetical protein M1827_006093 [Pycnora praestabilis]